MSFAPQVCSLWTRLQRLELFDTLFTRRCAYALSPHLPSFKTILISQRAPRTTSRRPNLKDAMAELSFCSHDGKALIWAAWGPVAARSLRPDRLVVEVQTEEERELLIQGVEEAIAKLGGNAPALVKHRLVVVVTPVEPTQPQVPD